MKMKIIVLLIVLLSTCSLTGYVIAEDVSPYSRLSFEANDIEVMKAFCKDFEELRTGDTIEWYVGEIIIGDTYFLGLNIRKKDTWYCEKCKHMVKYCEHGSDEHITCSNNTIELEDSDE